MPTVDMPQMGESVVEGTLSQWLVEVGEQVVKDQTICHISTDKIDTEVPSTVAGTVLRILVAEGETVPVGTPLIAIDTGSGSGTREAPLAEASEEEADQGSATVAAAPPAEKDPHPSSPVVRKMAEESGINLAAVKGTGAGGRVTKKDLLAFSAAQPKSASQVVAAASEPVLPLTTGRASLSTEPTEPLFTADQAPAEPPKKAPVAARDPAYSPFGGLYKVPVYTPKTGDRIVPFSRRRRIIAEHMVFSSQVAPHVSTVAEIDMTRVISLRREHQASFQEQEGINLTVLPFVVDATVRAIKEFPEINATVQMEHLVVRREINIGVAVETEQGLLVPVVRGAHNMNLAGIARVISMLTARARGGTLEPSDLADGSFTISNPGKRGNLFGIPIINQPQIAILRMGEVVKRPMVLELDGEDVIAVRHMMYLALSYDHRVVDGVLGNNFLYQIKKNLQEAEFTGL